MKKITLLILLFLFCHSKLVAETIITEGVAVIGSGITLEDATTVALNDAQQKALNSLGVFIESRSEVEQNILTKDEIMAITGAIIKSDILETTKEVDNETFILKIRAKFEVDNNSLDKALKNYQDRSKDKRMIQRLIEQIQKLQKQLLAKSKTDFELFEIVDEITFNNKRLAKLLTTREVIDWELTLQELYKKKIKRYVDHIFVDLVRRVKAAYRWDTVPRKYGARLELPPVTRHTIAFWSEIHWYRDMAKMSDEYNEKGLKIHPRSSFKMEFAIPVIVYVNEDRFVAGEINVSLGWRGSAEASYSGKFDYSDHRTNAIVLPQKYTLANIQDINVRLGKVNPTETKMFFWGKKEEYSSQ